MQAHKNIALASRILFENGVLDAFGHVSIRSEKTPDRFLMSRRKAPSIVEPDDVIELDLDGSPTAAPDTPVFLERYIHSEIYRKRKDVQAIVHSHSPDIIPFTVVPTAPLQPICHMCGFIQGVGEPFDVAHYEGDASDLLIRNAALGAALARHLGNANLVLMRGHGFTTVGDSLQSAVFHAIYTGVNGALQQAAMRLGAPTFLSPAEAEACERTTHAQIQRAWEHWVRQLKSPL